MESAQIFFEEFAGGPATSFMMLPQSGSSRRNYSAECSLGKFIVTTNANLRENQSFFYFSEVFSSLKLNSPKIFCISEDQKMYIQEYLGNRTLSEIIENECHTERVKTLVKKSLFSLHRLQEATKNSIDYSRTFEYESYDRLPVLHDLNYFKFFFADVLETPYHKSTLLAEFEELTEKISGLQPRSVMIRDFQARNIMVNDNDEVFFIDYQSAMEGPVMYDVVSLLYQAKADFSQEFRNEMLEYYYSLYPETARNALRESLIPIRLIRNLQVLGAYGFRGLVQKKEHFIRSITKGIENVQQTAAEWNEMQNFPELQKLIQNLSSADTSEKINIIKQQIQ